MSWKATLTLFLFCNLAFAQGFLCHKNSSKTNENIDFDEVSSFEWKLYARIEPKSFKTERPVAFNIYRSMSVKITSDNLVVLDGFICSLVMEFSCGNFYSYLSMAKVKDKSQNTSRMEYSFCSVEGNLIWSEVFLHYASSKRILVIYFCNKDIEFVTILTKVSEQTNVNKSEVIEETRKAVEPYYSNIFKYRQMLFYETDGINSSNCENIQSRCRRTDIFMFSDGNITKTTLKASNAFNIWKVFLSAAFALLVFVSIIQMVSKLVKCIKKRFRRNAVHPVSFNID